ncbi:lipopolysaccharide heptosyltransferase I [Thermodesulfovibrio yellowstonii]|uniref:Lipopolysaccharide heptosyltransferase 1 n=1 Tax=Thermodesulfovibrio yellowstonii TaxID=28262 RepID=A0A9W6GDX7_9BACT|nr:lipopolysaccharide heptosyltransferase I [Thermodesulfovibrio islandicus]GLI53499.1 lipopolysaccharide heptosyltransferase I [Thermodesulfovibrio islandicus]
MLKGNEKILIVKPSSLGDIVLSLPFLNVLKENFPYIQIHWIVAKEFEKLLNEHPMIEKVFVIDKNRWKSIKYFPETIKEFCNMGKELKSEKYDLVVDLQGLLRSGIITWLSKAPIKVGFKEAREFSSFFYNRKFSVPIHKHAILRYLEIAKELGCKINSIKFPLPDSKEPSWLRDFKDFVVIIPSARWQSKNWPIPYFVELIKMLPYKFLVIGSKSDEVDALKIEEYTKGKAISVAGKTTLTELIEVFKKSLFVITPDTGTMHLAVACGKKVVALFGPTDSARTGPFGNGHLVIKSKLSCSPCFKKFCHEQKCMRDISPEMVCDKIKNFKIT